MRAPSVSTSSPPVRAPSVSASSPPMRAPSVSLTSVQLRGQLFYLCFESSILCMDLYRVGFVCVAVCDTLRICIVSNLSRSASSLSVVFWGGSLKRTPPAIVATSFAASFMSLLIIFKPLFSVSRPQCGGIVKTPPVLPGVCGAWDA